MSDLNEFGTVPSVEVTILVDSLADMLARSSDEVKRFSSGPLIAEHGFSALIELPSEDLRILWDVGASPSTVLENLRRMEIDPTSIDVIALSHGHGDHVGGLSEILRAVRRRPALKMFPAGTTDEELADYAKPAPIPLIVHPAAFRERWSFLKDGRRRGPMNPTNRAEWEALGAEIIESEEPHRIAEGCWTTGYVPRESFETEGRAPERLRYRDGDRFHPDDTDEDQSIVLHVERKGLVIVSGCAHSGIVNTVRHAQKMSGVDTVHAVLGGFHLGRSSEEEVRRTVEAIVEARPAIIVPTHCTGFDAMQRFAHWMPDAFVLGTVGTKYTF
jgi:7,8-dihydropterin-6-yl-methyl-4-(beta-D-ribofuranosyl)aminobenzene 5'-phosphate synthase